jgi:hypothetical protein
LAGTAALGGVLAFAGTFTGAFAFAGGAFFELVLATGLWTALLGFLGATALVFVAGLAVALAVALLAPLLATFALGFVFTLAATLVGAFAGALTGAFTDFFTGAFADAFAGDFEEVFKGVLVAALTTFFATALTTFCAFLATAFTLSAPLVGDALAGAGRAFGFALDFFILSPQRSGLCQRHQDHQFLSSEQNYLNKNSPCQPWLTWRKLLLARGLYSY